MKTKPIQRHHRLLLIGLGCLIVVGGLLALSGHKFYSILPTYAQTHQEDHDHDHDHDLEANREDPAPPETEAEHEAEEEEHEEGVVHLSEAVREEFDIALATVEAGPLAHQLRLPGEIKLNDDALAHVAPRVAGMVEGVHKSVGDTVEAGELLAVVESRELAEAKAAYYAARERRSLTGSNLQREEKLWKAEISAERDYLEARQAHAEAQIALQAAAQQLHALGFSQEALDRLTLTPDTVFTRYALHAPIDGVIIQKHMTKGENVDSTTEAFTIADLSTVWVDITVYQKDLAHVRKGQSVTITNQHGLPTVAGKIAFVSPEIEAATRTTFARIILDNLTGELRPGLFVTGRITTEESQVDQRIPRSAITTIEEEDVVFVQTPEGFAVQAVELGRQNDTHAEVLRGLSPGARIAATNVLALKAQLDSAALEHAGHAH